MEEKLDKLLQLKTLHLFHPAKEDIKRPEVMAAVIYAASKMALATEYENAEVVCENELLDLFGQSENVDLKEMIPLSDPFVRQYTGLSIDVMDYGSVSQLFEMEPAYQSYYYDVFQRAERRKQDTPHI